MVCAALCFAVTPAIFAGPGSNTTVTSAADSGPGSLRQAILNANASGNSANINFNIPGPAPYIINLLSPLPTISNGIYIDGTTQTGYPGTPIVELNGSNAGTNANGLYLSGGNSTVQGLVIGGFSGAGIVLDINGNDVITQNYIGTDVSGTANLGNGGAGILIKGGNGDTIGGTYSGTGNIIAFNGRSGVAILSTNNIVRFNSIFSNAGPGVDFGAAGAPRVNDSGDGDAGPNNLQNYPVLTDISATGSSTTIRGIFNGKAYKTFQLDYYDSPTLDAAGYGDGATYLGSTSFTTDGNGNATFHTTLGFTIPANSYVTATATSSSGNTSEFCPPVPFFPTNAVNLSMVVNQPSTVTLFDQAVISLTIGNLGTNTASKVVLNDVFPSSLNYTFSVASQGTYSSSRSHGKTTVTWNVGTLPPGGEATLILYTYSDFIGQATNLAYFTCDQFNLNALGETNQLPINVVPPFGSLGSALTNLGPANAINFSAGASGHAYQWRLNGKNISGATNATYAKTNLQTSDAGSYTVVVADQNGVSSSLPGLVSIDGLPSFPVTDDFASRPSIGLLSNNVPFIFVCSNANDSIEPGEPMHAGVPGGNSVWFTWTAPPLMKGVVTISTAGSSFDTLTGVYTGSSVSNLNEIASNDDDGGFYTSKLMFNADGSTSGTSYSIAVDGAYGATGQIVVSINYDINAQPLPQITAQPVDQVVTPDAPATFSISATGPGVHYQWQFNDAPIPGATTSSLLVKNTGVANVGLYSVIVTNANGSVFSRHASLQISVLDGSVNTDGAAQDKFQAAFTASQVALGVLSFGSHANSVGVNSLNAHPTAGGTSRGYSSTQVFNTYGSGTQSGEPISCDNIGGSSAWTSIQAADTGVMTIITAGSSFTTVLGVYTGNADDFSSLTQIACEVGASTNANSSVTFATTSNTVYYIAVDGVNGAFGTVVLNWNLSVPPAITAQPGSQTAAPGATVTLVASANGHTLPQYQWMQNGVLLPGATNSSLVISNFQPSAAGDYQMVATNNVGEAVTVAATVLPNNALHIDSFHFNSSNQNCCMRLVGAANTSYVIQTSSDMRNWSTIATNVSSNGFWNFTDAFTTNIPQRYYRAQPGQ